MHFGIHRAKPIFFVWYSCQPPFSPLMHQGYGFYRRVNINRSCSFLYFSLSFFSFISLFFFFLFANYQATANDAFTASPIFPNIYFLYFIGFQTSFHIVHVSHVQPVSDVNFVFGKKKKKFPSPNRPEAIFSLLVVQ